MTFKTFLRLSEDWVLGYDPQQWIVMRRYPLKKGGEKLKAVGFIGSEKRILLRVLSEKGAVITPTAQRELDALPNSFRGWFKDFLEPSTNRRPPICERQHHGSQEVGKNPPAAPLHQMAGE